jgi:hypothetical protein
MMNELLVAALAQIPHLSPSQLAALITTIDLALDRRSDELPGLRTLRNALVDVEQQRPATGGEPTRRAGRRQSERPARDELR